ncbi:hypothetical protein LINPERPRIM_LOCUS19879 [Linum perenne]
MIRRLLMIFNLDKMKLLILRIRKLISRS